MTKDLVKEKVTKQDGICDAIPTPCGRGSGCVSEASYNHRGGVHTRHLSWHLTPHPVAALLPSPARGEGACFQNSGNPQSLINSNHFTHSTHLTHFKKAAFTLAEVLVTLAVIGIVAAMTIPTLVSNYQEKETVTKVKKFYSTISQAYQLATIDYGKASEWGIEGRDKGSQDDEEETYNAVNAILVRDKLLKYVKTSKVCDNAKDQTACGVADKIYMLDDNINPGMPSQTASAMLTDGSTILVLANSANDTNRGPGELSHVWANIHYDVNGIKPPNTEGKDIFAFYLAENSVIPFGTPNETTYSFENDCASFGSPCTAWVVYNGNMDYLKCPDDLSWNGKHKCSD